MRYYTHLSDASVRPFNIHRLEEWFHPLTPMPKECVHFVLMFYVLMFMNHHLKPLVTSLVLAAYWRPGPLINWSGMPPAQYSNQHCSYSLKLPFCSLTAMQ